MSFERPRNSSLFAALAAIATLTAGNAEAQATETDCRATRERVESYLRKGERPPQEIFEEAFKCPDLPENPPEEVSGSNYEDSTALTPRERRERERRERAQRRRPE